MTTMGIFIQINPKHESV